MNARRGCGYCVEVVEIVDSIGACSNCGAVGVAYEDKDPIVWSKKWE